MEDLFASRRRAPRFRQGNGQWLVAFLWIPLLISAAAGQAIEEPSVVPPKPQPDDAVIELPPFQVSPSEGWVAQDTLIGTGIRSPYRDLATQIEVLTPDFMEDFAVNSIEDAAIYTTNVESPDEFVEGLGFGGELVSGSQNGGGLARPFRIRGLTQDSKTRFYVPTFLPTDGYNLSRTEIAYGPNSILFGTAQLAGTINALPTSAEYRNGGRLEVQVDSNGSVRFELDYNQLLVEDILSVRVAALYDDHRYEFDPGRDLNRRLFLTGTYQPFTNTVIQGYFETVDLERSIPNRSLPDDLVTTWHRAGELPNSGYTDDRPIFLNDLAWAEKRLLEEQQQVFTTGYKKTISIVPNETSSYMGLLASWENSVGIRYPDTWRGRSALEDWRVHYTLRDDTVFPTDVALMAALNQSHATGNIFNLVLNQKILDGLNLEISGNSERMENLETYGVDGATTTIQVDANAYLPDGVTLNPNVGKLYMEEVAAYMDNSAKSDFLRAALSYEYDFNQNEDSWVRWLGMHRLVGIASMQQAETRGQVRRYTVMPEVLANGAIRYPDIPGAELDPDEYPHLTWQDYTELKFRYYLDPPNGEVVPHRPFVIGRPLSLVDGAGASFTIDPENSGFFDEEGHRLIRGTTRNSLKWQEDVTQLSYQGSFWDDRIIVTYGYRASDIKAAELPWRADYATGLRPHSRDASFRSWEPSFASTATTHMEGIAVAPFRGWLNLPQRADLSFYYHQSQSTLPADAWHDPFGNRYAGSHGEGKDAGIRLSLFGDDLALEVNRYDVYSRPNPSLYRGTMGILGILENRVRELDPDFPRLTGPSGIGFTDPLPLSQFNYMVMSDALSSGYEISGRWRLGSSLEMRFSIADLEVTETDIGLEWWEWMDQRLPVYETLDVPEGGVENPSDIDGDGVVGRWTWETARMDDKIPEETLATYWDNEVIKGINGREVTQSYDGKSNPFIRDLRVNLNAMYRFTEGPFRGLKLGGAFRYREAPLLNYGGMVYEGFELLDLTQPLYGKAEWYLDLLARYRIETSWMGDHATTVSLNVRNVLNQNGPIPSHLDINGEPVRLARVEGIKFILSLGLEL
ncbi:MAG: hypothetical protein R3F07_01465 [Opitutaceae bacterium]